MRTAPLFLALLALLPCAAQAQLDPVPARPRVAVTAYTGVRVPYNTGFVTLRRADGSAAGSYTEQRGGGVLLGADAEVWLSGPLHLLLGGTYSPGGISTYFAEREGGFRDTGDFRIRFTDETLFARAGVSLRVEGERPAGETRPRPATDLFAAAALVRQFDSSHPAANFGFKGAFPIGERGLELVVGVEDYLVFWRRDELTPLLAEVLRPSAEPVSAELLYDTSNVVLVRLGASLRF